MRKLLAATPLLALLWACAAAPHSAPLPVGARYVAMGSSYAAGVDIGPLVAGTPTRCGRNTNNYAHLLAARLRLDLVDVSCGGATTAHILGPWSELPAQLDAVTPDTRLITVTIGGNDVNYVRNLMMASCGQPGGLPAPASGCPHVAAATEADWADLETRMHQIAREVAHRAPNARLVFVDYLRSLPESTTCAAVPLSPEALDAARQTFRRLAELTARVAREEGALLIPAGEMSRGHEACSAEPWGVGHPARTASWHPTAAGHAAIAAALADRLGTR